MTNPPTDQHDVVLFRDADYLVLGLLDDQEEDLEPRIYFHGELVPKDTAVERAAYADIGQRVMRECLDSGMSFEFRTDEEVLTEC